MLRAWGSVCTGLPESVTRAVKLYVPLVVGVPEIVPVPLLSVRPGGSEPLSSDHAYGLVPPVAASVREYWLPTLPFDSDDVVIANVAACTVRDVLPLTDPNVALMVELPAATPVASPPVVPVVIVAAAVFELLHVTWLVMFCVLASL